MKVPHRLIPVRFRVRNVFDNPKYPKYYRREFYVERNDGKPLTYPIPFKWAQLIAMQINRSFSAQTTKRHGDVFLLGTLRIEGNPVEEQKAPIVAPDKDGMLVLGENPEYSESIRKAYIKGEELFMGRAATLPIKHKIIVCCEFHIKSKKRYTLPLCQAWALDALHRLNIIRSKTSEQVVSMDGSKIIRDRQNKSPYAIVTIWQVGTSYCPGCRRKPRAIRTKRKWTVFCLGDWQAERLARRVRHVE